MKTNTLFKRVFLAAILFAVSIYSMGQVSIPFSSDGGNTGTSIAGLIQSGSLTDNIGVNSATIASKVIVIAKPTITLTDVTNPTLSTFKGIPVTQTLNVSGINLNVDLGLAISGADARLFSLSQYEVTETGGIAPNTVVTITYTPNTVGDNTAYLTMSSTGAMPVVRTLNGISTIATDVNTPSSVFAVSVENGHILFTAAAGESVDIYSALGQRLVHKTALEGVNTISVHVKGVVLVKVGNRFAKVIL